MIRSVAAARFLERLGRVAPFFAFLISPFIVYPWAFVRAGLLDGGDDAIFNLPVLRHSAEKLLHLHVSWTPSLWLGTPLVDEPEFATFYLPRLMLLAFSPVLGFAIYVVLHYVLAQASFYLYTRLLGVSRLGATFGALVYGFSGFMLGHRGHTMYVVAGAWAPLVLVLLERAERRARRLDLLWVALAFAQLPLAGAVQLTVYLAGTIVALAAVRALYSRDLGKLLPSLLAVGSGVLLAAPQESCRASSSYRSSSRRRAKATTSPLPCRTTRGSCRSWSCRTIRSRPPSSTAAWGPLRSRSPWSAQ